jgi:hypothetical protein
VTVSSYELAWNDTIAGGSRAHGPAYTLCLSAPDSAPAMAVVTLTYSM